MNDIEARKEDVLPFPTAKKGSKIPQEAKIRNFDIDFGTKVGSMKPLHGVGNGPVTTRFIIDKTEEFINAGIPYSRLHDTEGFMGSGEFVNIHCIFKDFDADVNDPKSYSFAHTDAYLKCIENAGTKIFYRLGETIENNYSYIRSYTTVPKDMQKWAEICEHIIRHYNEGWADGYHMGIEYWEIWNEPEGAPDTSPNWNGTKEEYFELYRITANHLKKCFPDIKVGGYASTGFYEVGRDDQPMFAYSYMRDFFDYITDKSTYAPIDFFSWHFYGTSAERVKFEIEESKKLLDEYNLGHIENIIDEWNYMECWAPAEAITRKSIKGAAFVSAVHCVMQKSALSKSMYYDAEIYRCSFCGLFDVYTAECMKPYYSFVCFNQLYRLGDEVKTEGDGDGIYALAAKGREKQAILLVNYEGTDSICMLNLKNSVCKSLELYLLDENNDLSPLNSIKSDGIISTVNVNMKKNSVLLIEMN